MEVGFRQSDKSVSGGIVGFGFDEGVGNVLAVGTDVLDRGGAGEAGDFAHGFDASETFGHGVFDDVVPVVATQDFEYGAAVVGWRFGDTAHAIDDNNTVEAFVVADGVGAVAHDKSGKMVLLGKTIGVGDVGGLLDFDDVASGAAEAHGGKT